MKEKIAGMANENARKMLVMEEELMVSNMKMKVTFAMWS